MGRASQAELLKKQKKKTGKTIPVTAEPTKSQPAIAKDLKTRPKPKGANIVTNADGTVSKKAVRRIRREKIFEGGVLPTKKFRRAPFVRLTKAMVADIWSKEEGREGQEAETQMRISKPAFDMAQALVERYVGRLYRSATEVAKMGGKVTLKPQMLNIALKMSHNGYN